MATITQQEAAQFITKLGFEQLTQIEFDAFIEVADDYDAAFTVAGYSDAKIRQIKLYLVALQSINGVRQTASQSVDVLSKSYKYGTLEDTYDWLSVRIIEADQDGVVDIPAQGGGSAFIMTVGGCYE
ncbi:hypothetical protein D3C79_470710 [compost metagenome]